MNEGFEPLSLLAPCLGLQQESLCAQLDSPDVDFPNKANIFEQVKDMSVSIPIHIDPLRPPS